MKTWLALVALAPLAVSAFAPATPAHAKSARCKIASSDGRYIGPCTFTPTGKGSFSVAHPARRPLVARTTVINVYVVGPGLAEVSGLTTDGINSRWGEAARSKTDRACWIGQDFTICVI